MHDRLHTIAVTGVVVKDGKYLITKRSPNKKHFPGKWTIPGGKMEMDDYAERKKDTSSHWYNVIETVLRREILEETGLKIKNIRYLTSLSFISKGVPSIVLSLFAEHESGEVKLSSESTEHVWVTVEEAKNYDMIEGIYEELEMLDKYLKTGQMEEWKPSK
jgi:8-oxo-dGTP diphosphatase